MPLKAATSSGNFFRDSALSGTTYNGQADVVKRVYCLQLGAALLLSRCGAALWKLSLMM